MVRGKRACALLGSLCSRCPAVTGAGQALVPSAPLHRLLSLPLAQVKGNKIFLGEMMRSVPCLLKPKFWSTPLTRCACVDLTEVAMSCPISKLQLLKLTFASLSQFHQPGVHRKQCAKSVADWAP